MSLLTMFPATGTATHSSVSVVDPIKYLLSRVTDTAFFKRSQCDPDVKNSVSFLERAVKFLDKKRLDLTSRYSELTDSDGETSERVVPTFERKSVHQIGEDRTVAHSVTSFLVSWDDVAECVRCPLLKQLRMPNAKSQLEAPAGKTDPNHLNDRDGAKAEIKEESGYTVTDEDFIYYTGARPKDPGLITAMDTLSVVDISRHQRGDTNKTANELAQGQEMLDDLPIDMLPALARELREKGHTIEGQLAEFIHGIDTYQTLKNYSVDPFTEYPEDVAKFNDIVDRIGRDSLTVVERSDLINDLNVLLRTVTSQLRIGPNSWTKGGSDREKIKKARDTIQSFVTNIHDRAVGLDYARGKLCTYNKKGEQVVETREFVGFKRQSSGSDLGGSDEAHSFTLYPIEVDAEGKSFLKVIANHRLVGDGKIIEAPAVLVHADDQTVTDATIRTVGKELGWDTTGLADKLGKGTDFKLVKGPLRTKDSGTELGNDQSVALIYTKAPPLKERTADDEPLPEQLMSIPLDAPYAWKQEAMEAGKQCDAGTDAFLLGVQIALDQDRGRSEHRNPWRNADTDVASAA